MARGRKVENLAGKTFGMLKAVEVCEERGNYGSLYWWCECRCGKKVKVRASSLKRGDVRSCGCLIRADRRRDTPYPVNEDCALYLPGKDECKGLDELMCATRGYCKFFKPKG